MDEGARGERRGGTFLRRMKWERRVGKDPCGEEGRRRKVDTLDLTGNQPFLVRPNVHYYVRVCV